MTSLAENVGGQVLSGNPDPKEVISLPADMISGALNVIPVVGPILSQVVDTAKDVALAFVTITQQVNQFAESLAYVSAPISQAKAKLEVKQVEQDIELEGRMGQSLAKVYETSGEIWLDVKKILASFAEPLVDMLALALPFIREMTSFFANFLSNSNESFQGFNTLINVLLAAGGLPGLFLSGIRMWRAYKQEEQNTGGKDEIVRDIFKDIIRTDLATPFARTMPSGIGV
jgi:hypothetical protein